MAEGFAGGDVGEVYLNDRNVDGSDGVGNGNRGMGVSAGVKDNAGVGGRGGLDVVDEFAFEVRLEIVDGDVGVFGAEVSEVVFKGARAVEGGFAGTKKIEIGTVEYEYVHWVVVFLVVSEAKVVICIGLLFIFMPHLKRCYDDVGSCYREL